MQTIQGAETQMMTCHQLTSVIGDYGSMHIHIRTKTICDKQQALLVLGDKLTMQLFV